MQKLKIYFVLGDLGGCGEYRGISPGRALKEKGHKVKWDTKISWKEAQSLEYDIYVFQRVMSKGVLDLMKEIKKRRIVILENDDNFKALPFSNPAFHIHHPNTYHFLRIDKYDQIPPFAKYGFFFSTQNDNFLYPDGKEFKRVLPKGVLEEFERKQMISRIETKYVDLFKHSDLVYFCEKEDHVLTLLEATRVADAVTVSTDHLARIHSSDNRNVYVLENYINTEQYNKIEKPRSKKIRVGWSGTMTHRQDVAILQGWPETLCAEYKNIQWIIGNDKQIYDNFLVNVSKQQKKFLPGTDMKNYPNLIAHFDIGLVPLEDNQFNQSKSGIKGLEYMGLGIPFVATPTESYLNLYNERAGFFLAKKGKHWGRYLRMLIENKELRNKMGKEAKIYAQEYDIKRNIYKWEDLYTELIKEIRPRKNWG